MEQKIPRSVGIHDGTFHADEVTACALLLLFDRVDKEKIVRTRDKEKLAHCEYVCDVGGVYDDKRKLFDHHQIDYHGELSSAGMILNYLKQKKAISKEEFDFFNQSLVKGVDDHDNGRSNQEFGSCTFSHVIANYNPINYEANDEEMNKAFFEALDFAMGHISRLYERYNYNKRCRISVKEAMQKYRTCLIFDQAIPWLESFFALDGKEHSALFVIMPAKEHWKLRGIPPDYEHRMQVRVPMLASWAGLLEDKLKKVTGIPGAIFCHKGRFISVWETKDDALKALAIILEANGRKNEDNF